MRLLIYSHFFAPSVGGVETIVSSLAEGLAEWKDGQGRGDFEVTVATQTAAGAEDDGARPFRVIRQPRTAELRRLIRECDVVHVAGPAISPMALAWISGKLFVVEHHGYQSICPNGLLVHQPDGRICPGHFQARHYGECLRCERASNAGRSGLAALVLTGIRNWLVRRAKANIAVSDHVDRRIALPHSRVIYHGNEIPNSADAVPAGRVCFAFVGRFVPEKGIEVLLEAAAALRKQRSDFAIKLIGDGPEREKLERLIAAHNMKDAVAITGFLRGSALRDALRDVVVVMPSLWEETAGLSAMEQMMRGRLVIASRVGGLAEIVADSGMTFELGSSDGLAHCMLQVLNQPSLIESYGGKARLRACELFQRSRMLAEHAALYRRVAG
jgi:glycogen synthase